MTARAVMGLALAAAAGTLVSCYIAETPGTGSRAETGYRAAAPVITALESFHRDHARYPRSLQELAPHYLSAPTTKLETYYVHGFRYNPRGGSYTLGFRYDAAAINDCDYDSKTKKWDCSGYF